MKKPEVIGWLMALSTLAAIGGNALHPDDVEYLNEAIRLLEEGDGDD